MNIIKKILTTILCFILVFSLAGCGSGSGENEDVEETQNEYVYTAEYQAMEGDFSGDILMRGNTMYYTSYYYDAETETSGQRIYSMDLISHEETVMAYIPTSGTPYAMTVLDDGGIALLLFAVNYDTGEQTYELLTLDADGTETLRQDITAVLSEGSDPEYGVYPQSMEADGNGNIYIYVLVSGINKSVMIFDAQGQRQANIQADGLHQTLCRSGDSRVFAVEYDQGSINGGYQLVYINPQAGALGDTFDGIPAGSGNLYCAPGGDNEILFSMGDRLYSYDLIASVCSEILNWIDSGIDASNLQGIVRLEDGRILAIHYDYTDEQGETELVYLTQTPASQVRQKTILTYGTAFLDYDMRAQIIEFNKTNDTYRIEVEEYGLTDDETMQLDSAIVSGSGPDIIDLSSVDVENYISSGILTDLYPLMNADPSLNQEDLQMNILEAMEREGKLYGIIPSYSVQVLMGRVSDLGDRTSWTVQDVEELLASKPEGTAFIDYGSDYGSREYLLQTLLQLNLDSYIDWNTASCSFDSQEFIDVLEFVGTFPSVEELRFDHYEDSYDRLRNGQTLMMAIDLLDVQRYAAAAAMFGGDSVRCIGYPTSHGTGVILNTFMSYGISEDCEHKDGAWAFLSSLLSEDFQDNISWQFPIRISSLEKKLAKEMDPETYTNGGMSAGSFSYKYQPITQEQADAIREVLSMAEPMSAYNQDIFTIISEEAAPYFAGQKSAADAAEVMQNRIQIYVSENSSDQ